MSQDDERLNITNDEMARLTKKPFQRLSWKPWDNVDEDVDRRHTIALMALCGAGIILVILATALGW